MPAESPARAARVEDGRWLGGVCTGLARHLGWPLLAVRLAFVVLAALQFIGVGVYAVLWLVLPPAPVEESAPGLESHRRTGLRPGPRLRTADAGAVLAVAAVALGLVLLMQNFGLGLPPGLFWTIALASAGVGLIWRQADEIAGPSGPRPGRGWRGLLTASGMLAASRVIVGLLLIGAAFTLVIVSLVGTGQLARLLPLMVLGLAVLGVVAAPWLYRSRQALASAREAQIRADARADMAAHLHDSVLQTLALIQRQAEDPKQVQRLARRQERELRTWLYGLEQPEPTLRAALEAVAAEIEDERGVNVELICVGDIDLDERLLAVVAAAREALVNAAKHAGVDRVDVYAEVDPGLIEVFVRDRGVGFEVANVASDRHGVRDSILNRMDRHGGRAVIRSAPGEGTEVRLEITP